MAKDKRDEQDEEPIGEAPKKKKGKLPLILMILAALAGGGGAAWYFMQINGGHEVKEEKPKPPVFVTLETFTVNLQGDEHYLQVGVDLKVADQSVAEAVKVHMPEIRNGVLLLLSSKRAEDLSTMEGKQKLSMEIQDQVNKPLGLKPGAKGVIGVYFTSFVIQ
jgi:flagellar FliL protein